MEEVDRLKSDLRNRISSLPKDRAYYGNPVLKLNYFIEKLCALLTIVKGDAYTKVVTESKRNPTSDLLKMKLNQPIRKLRELLKDIDEYLDMESKNPKPYNPDRFKQCIEDLTRLLQ